MINSSGNCSMPGCKSVSCFQHCEQLGAKNWYRGDSSGTWNFQSEFFWQL